MKCATVALGALVACAAFAFPNGAIAQERTVKITGFGAKSGVVRVFGINSEAAMKADVPFSPMLSHHYECVAV